MALSKSSAARAGLLAGAAGTGLTAATLGVIWHRLVRRPLPKQKGTIEVAGQPIAISLRNLVAGGA